MRAQYCPRIRMIDCDMVPVYRYYSYRRSQIQTGRFDALKVDGPVDVATRQNGHRRKMDCCGQKATEVDDDHRTVFGSKLNGH